MEAIYIIYLIISVVASLATALIPSLIKIVKLAKEKDRATTTASSEQAQNAINAEVKKLVENAEVYWAEIDKLLKANKCGTAGSVKKRDVVQALRVFCLENGYAWNNAAMDELIEREVAFTNAVNAKEK